MLVSAGEGHINKLTHMQTSTQTHTFIRTHTHTLYLAGDVAVASHLALGTPQQGLTSRQKDREKD